MYGLEMTVPAIVTVVSVGGDVRRSLLAGGRGGVAGGRDG